MLYQAPDGDLVLAVGCKILLTPTLQKPLTSSLLIKEETLKIHLL